MHRVGGADIPGAAHLVLTDGVVHLDPKEAVFDAMSAGWQRQQRTRFLSDEGTIGPRLTLIRRFAQFTNSYPWQWEPAAGQDFIVHLRSGVGRTPIRCVDSPIVRVGDLIVHGVRHRHRYGWPTVRGTFLLCRNRSSMTVILSRM